MGRHPKPFTVNERATRELAAAGAVPSGEGNHLTSLS